jgi:hypothetical protein
LRQIERNVSSRTGIAPASAYARCAPAVRNHFENASAAFCCSGGRFFGIAMFQLPSMAATCRLPVAGWHRLYLADDSGLGRIVEVGPAAETTMPCAALPVAISWIKSP